MGKQIQRKTLMRAAADGRRAQGRTELVGYWAGDNENRLARIRAKCYECTGYYADGVKDCGNDLCPLYPDHPYSPTAKETNRKKMELTDEEREARRERMKKVRRDRSKVPAFKEEARAPDRF